jgi:ABC-type phosphate/phosphonate transport system substrate-binding protein
VAASTYDDVVDLLGNARVDIAHLGTKGFVAGVDQD